MKAYGEVDAQIQGSLNSPLIAGEWSVSRLHHFTRGERAFVAHWIELGGSSEPV
jgi:hypothetical protein